MSRICLPEKKVLSLTGHESGLVQKFLILREIGSGGSAVCYEAQANGVSGTLKEYYPYEEGVHSGFVREETTGLLQDTDHRYQEEIQAYQKPYEDIQRICQKNAFCFFPHFELFDGGDSVYLWTARPACMPFSTYLEKVYKAPEKSPIEYLTQILLTIRQLAICINEMHKIGLLHGDIKPSNFGADALGEDYLAQTISLFDINSVCSVEQPELCGRMGSEGYAPLMDSVYTVKSDVYAIGATLFFSLTNQKYTPEKEENLPRLLRGGKLFQCSEFNADPDILRILTLVLKKALCQESAHRYTSCTEFLCDFDLVFPLLRIAGLLKSNGSHKRSLSNWKKRLQTEIGHNVHLALQQHLFAHPILPDAQKKSITVCVDGFGKIGQRYLDMLLKVLHFPDVTVQFYVMVSASGEQALYLQQRPALQNFYCIDGETPDADCYGSLSFLHAMEDLTVLPDLVFISGTNDAAVLRRGRQWRIKFPELPIQCALSSEKSNCPQTLSPVFLQKQIPKKNRETLSQMAWNTHLVWKKQLNIPWRKIQAEYRQPYNTNSCIFFVLTMWHNLLSMGFHPEHGICTEIMEKIQENRDSLICNEHARWVTEKIVDGYLPKPVDNANMKDRKTKDEANRKHVCIVPAKKEHRLQTWTHAQWDRSEETEFAQLDPLEQMSVRLHRIYREQAAQVRKSDNVLGTLEHQIQKVLPESEKAAWDAFYLWFNNSRDVFHGVSEKTKCCESMQQKFLDQIQNEPHKKQIVAAVEVFSHAFQPILLAAEYRDYKQDDVKLIDNIPFILTYQNQFTLAIPFDTENPILDYFYAPLIVNPQSIKYLWLINTRYQCEKLEKALSSLQFLKEKNVRSSVEWILVDPEQKISPSDLTRIQDAGYGYQVFSDKHALLEWLQSQNRPAHPCMVESNNAALSVFLEECKELPHYRYRNGALQNISGAESLSYIRKTPVLLVNDFVRISGATGHSLEQPEFQAEYAQLFACYRRNPDVWKDLCTQLSKQNDKVPIHKKVADAQEEDFRMLLPDICGEGARKILKECKDRQFISNYRSAWINTETFEIQLRSTCKQKEEFQKLFEKTDALLYPDRMLFYPDKQDPSQLWIYTGSLHVSLQIPNDEEKAKAYTAILTELSQLGLLLNLRKQGNLWLFTYATDAVRRLLTVAGRVLEVYVYHKLVENGTYDDVVNSYLCRWNDKDALKNEFDIFLTKNMKATLIECKARNEVKSDFLYKLSCIKNRFASDLTVVLLIDSKLKIKQNIQESADYEQIRVIHEATEIEQICDTLEQL